MNSFKKYSKSILEYYTWKTVLSFFKNANVESKIYYDKVENEWKERNPWYVETYIHSFE